jgi:hypothetical protein
MRMNKRSQVLSTDLVYGVVAFMVIVIIFLGVLLYNNLTKGVDKYEFEMDYLFLNLEKNVEQLSDDKIFISDSRVNVSKLKKFVDFYKDKSIDKLVVGYIGNANGIGLDPAAYDTCLYFTDYNGDIIAFDGVQYLGIVKIDKLTERSCQEEITFKRNPCEYFNDAISLFKPVLFDEGNFNLNRIIQMNLVVCRT